MSRIASIDIGTNTALLLIADVQGQEILPILQRERIVRLGEGVDKAKRLRVSAIDRTMSALRSYLNLTKGYRVEKVLISGTSAMRDADNGDRLVNLVKSEFGIGIKILSGDEEARLTYWGALSNKSSLIGEILLIDIGGGSTEFIFGTQKQINYMTSINIGSVRLTERFITTDPITDPEFKVLQEYIRSVLHGIDRQQFQLQHFVAVAGTITTLASIHLKIENYDPEKIENCVLKLIDIEGIVDILKAKPLAERKKITGLNPRRADVILAGAVILFEVMQYFEIQRVIVSDRGLRFGLILDSIT